MLSDKDAEKIKKMVPGKAIPFIIIFIFIIWFVLPMFLTTGIMLDSFIFPIFAFILGIVGNLLFWGLMIYAIIKVFKLSKEQTDLQGTNQESANTEIKQEEMPDDVPEEVYMMQTGRLNDEAARKIYEREIFPYEHPKLYAIQKTVIPFIWFLIVLFVIITVLISNGIIKLAI